MHIIEVSHLTKDYGFGRGVFDVSFHVDRGEVFGFLGPNGSGKSTTIRHLMGFSRPDRGQTKLFGLDTFPKYSEILGRVGYIPGEIALPAGLTGWQFLRMMQNMQNRRDPERLRQLLSVFELDPAGDTKRMSLGVKRKLAIVTAFMNDPEVLILDEPTSGLDPVMQDVFVDYIKNEKRRGKTILLSSHIFSEVDATCDRIAIIKDGEIVSDFVADDLKHASQKTYQVTFPDEAQYTRFLADSDGQETLTVVTQQPETLTVVIATDDRHINDVIALFSAHSICGLVHLKETLEDYFMRYYKEDKTFGGALEK